MGPETYALHTRRVRRQLSVASTTTSSADWRVCSTQYGRHAAASSSHDSDSYTAAARRNHTHAPWCNYAPDPAPRADRHNAAGCSRGNPSTSGCNSV